MHQAAAASRVPGPTILLGILAACLSVAALLPAMLIADFALSGGVLAPGARAAEAEALALGDGHGAQPDAGARSSIPRFHRQPWIAQGLAAAHRVAEWPRRNESWLRGLLIAAGALAGLALLCQFLQARGAAVAAGVAADHWRHRLLLDGVPLGPLAFHPEFGQRLAQLLRDDVRKIAAGRAADAEAHPRELVRGGLFLLLAAALNPWLGLAVALALALAWMLAHDVGRRAAAGRDAAEEHARGQLERLRGAATRVRLVRGYVSEEHYRQQVGKTLDAYRRDAVRQQFAGAARRMGWAYLALLAALALAALSAWNVVTDRHGVAAAGAVIACAAGAAVSLSAWLRGRRAAQAAAAAAERVEGFLRDAVENAPPDGTIFLPAVQRGIEFSGVHFRDAAGAVLLDGFDALFPAGRRTALLAVDPAEARAALDLLARFMDPARGVVRFDNQDLRGATLESLRAQVCVVAESDLLFPDTVAGNIGGGDPAAARERIVAAAQQAHAHHFIERLPHGYDCAVGEGGLPLKPGEAYRIALARVILRDPAVVALEEPPGPLDPATDAVLDDAYHRFLPGRTAIVVPTRQGTLKHCDHVVAISRGQVVAAGSPDDLFANHPVCRYLLLTRFAPAAG